MPDAAPSRSHRRRRRPAVLNSEHARDKARRRLPRMIFDFVDGATGFEATPARNRRAFEEVLLQPRALRNVAERDLSLAFLDERFGAPIGVAPMGMCALAHPEADRLLGAACRDRGLPLGASTAASTSIEDMRALAGDRAWFQLYVAPSVDAAMVLVDRARRAGYGTLVLTVDVPHVARRVRDLRNGFQAPLRFGPSQLLDFALHPAWSLRMLAHGAPRPVNFDTTGGPRFDRDADRSGADWRFLDRLRAEWDRRLIVKGVSCPQDARRIRDAGAAAGWVSNHGGRQLDSAPAAIDALPRIRAAIGRDYPLILDSGVRSGEDVVKALALGADLVMLGRPFLFALGAAGREGLEDFLDGLLEEISTAMAQIGVRSIAEIGPEHLVDASPALSDRAPNDASVLDLQTRMRS